MTLPSATSKTLIGFFLVPFLIMIGIVGYASYLVLEVKRLENRVIQTSGEWHRLHLSSHLVFTFSSGSDDELRQWRALFDNFDASLDHLQGAADLWLIGESTKNRFRNMREVWLLTKSKLETSLDLYTDIQETPLGRQLSQTPFSNLVDMASRKINGPYFPRENIWKFYRLQDHLTDLNVAGEVLEELMDQVSSEIAIEARFLINAIIITTLATALLVLSIAFMLNKNALAIRERTERSLREGRTALLARERHLQGVLDNIADAVVTIDEQGNIETFNSAAVKVFGFSAQEACGLNVSVLMADPDRSRHDDYIKTYRKTGERTILGFGTREITAQHKDGQTFPIEISVGEVKLSDRRVFIGAMRDITERKKAEHDLRQSEERFRAIAEASPVPLIITRRSDGRILYANPRVGPALGLAEDELVGRPMTDFYGDSSEREERLSALDKDGYVRDDEIEMRKEDGSPISTIHSLQVIEYQGEEAVLGGFYDITARKRAEQEIQRLNEDLERRVEERTSELRAAQEELLRQERMATLGQLTATVSHELRNPLGVIRTSAYVVRSGLNEEAPIIKRSLERIERSIVRCDRIIDELLDFTRISDLELEPTGIDAWLEATLNEQVIPPRVALRLEFSIPDVAVPFDRDRFRRAIINVFDNGCQAMAGKVQEDTGSAERSLTVRTREHNGRVEVIFEDTGPGIPPDVYERIFEPLYSTKGFGVGLGLPVVRQIMQQHGGGIEIESEEGRGARVCLWLPIGHSIHGLRAHGAP